MQKSTRPFRQHPISGLSLKRAGSVLTAAALTLMVGSAQATDWDMPTPYGDSNFHTVNIQQFADDVREATEWRAGHYRSQQRLVDQDTQKSRTPFAVGWCLLAN